MISDIGIFNLPIPRQSTEIIIGRIISSTPTKILICVVLFFTSFIPINKKPYPLKDMASD